MTTISNIGDVVTWLAILSGFIVLITNTIILWRVMHNTNGMMAKIERFARESGAQDERDNPTKSRTDHDTR